MYSYSNYLFYLFVTGSDNLCESEVDGCPQSRPHSAADQPIHHG